MSFERYVYWRVQDDQSRSWIDDKGNIVAGSRANVTFYPYTIGEEDKLCDALMAHLDWGNRRATPFVSVYGDRGLDRAEGEANRRVRDGHTNVRIFKIRVGPGERVQFRHMHKLIKRYNLDVLDRARRNAEYEFVFLDYIPAELIEGCTEFDD